MIDTRDENIAGGMSFSFQIHEQLARLYLHPIRQYLTELDQLHDASQHPDAPDYTHNLLARRGHWASRRHPHPTGMKIFEHSSYDHVSKNHTELEDDSSEHHTELEDDSSENHTELEDDSSDDGESYTGEQVSSDPTAEGYLYKTYDLLSMHATELLHVNIFLANAFSSFSQYEVAWYVLEPGQSKL